MNLFYVPEIEQSLVTLPDEEARHVVQVMRKRVGEEIMLVDGKGHWYRLEITEASKKKCVGRILESLEPEEKRNFYLHLAIAPTKNINRFEWFLEKATEFGIDEITPIICQRSERKNLREDRLEKIIVTAMKQSLKAYLPKLNPASPFSDLMDRPFEGQKFIA